MSSNRSRPLLISLTVLVSIIALGELFALLLDYQNNFYLRQYVSNSTPLIFEQIIGLALLGSGSAFLAYKLSTSRPTGRLGRASRRIRGLSPIIAVIIALVLYFTVFTSVFGSSLIGLEVYGVIVLFVISLGMMTRDRITVRMSLRNFTRRKTNMAIVIAGLMIGTAMISGSLVTGDTLTNLFTRGAYNGYGYADEVVYTQSGSGGYQFFDLNIAHSLYQDLSRNSSAGPLLRGVTPEILIAVPLVNDTTKGVGQAGATLIGTYNNASQTLGDFHANDGSVIQSSLTDSQAIVNDRAARDLNATVGDQLTIFSPFNQTFFASVKLVGIAVSDARGSFSGSDNVFVTISTAQALTFHPGSANYITITNVGGLRNSIQYTSTVGLAANETLNNIQPHTSNFSCKTSPNAPGNSTTILCAYGSKMVAVNDATAGAQSLSNLFSVLSTITILAGVVLIINMFIMLAEERKSEMGMARAVGMKRSQLTKLFLFEGTLYAAGASLVGVFVGIGIAYGILYSFGKIISGFFPVSFAQVLDSFTFTPTSLFTAFAEGLFITYLTILLTSWRVSKLNIIRAVRDIPEPPRGVRTYTVLSVLGVVLAILGVFLFEASFATKSAIEALVGPSLVVLGTGLVLSRFLKNRYAFTLTGLALLVQWGVPSFSFNSSIIQSYTFGPEILIVGGMIMVMGAILLALYNTDVILKILHLFYRGRKRLTVIFKTALSYPASKRFRTGATVAMFALVLLSVTVIAFLTAEQTAALDTVVRQDSGGYDVLTQTTLAVPDLAARIGADTNLNGKVAAVIPFNNTGVVVKDLTSGADFGPQLAVGADPNATSQNNFFKGNTFNMALMAIGYKTALDVWTAVTTNSSNVVWSFGSINFNGPPTGSRTPAAGDLLQLFYKTSPGITQSKNVTVAGVVNGVFFSGIVATSGLLKNSFGVGTGQLGFMKVSSGVDPTAVSIILKKDFARLGMQPLAIAVVIGTFVQIGQSFLGIFEAFLALGLVVGIAGLGIISIRSVVERRKEIGVLRAIGYRKNMVLSAFLLENSYVALLGILIGIVLGIDLGYAIATSPGSGLTFVIPWISLLEIIAFSYGLAVLTTIGSSRRAARIPPAEALRYTE
ncbi:MAG TPA: FtsX-like permease family protein [Candidatus Bathyarchaeia archaeon]